MIPKPIKIVSKKIRQSARGESCTLRIPGVCNGNPETTVFAHLSGNRGTGTKNHDLFGVYSCSSCHDWLDGRVKYITYPVNAEDKLRALQETQILLVGKGLITVS